MVRHPAGAAAALLAENEAGSPAWWQRVAEVGTPIVEEVPGFPHLKLTFFWRDPQGDESTSPICRVYLDINGVTNHHSFSPASLERLPGSDIWTTSLQQANDWRGSYSLIPVNAAQLPPEPTGMPEQQREWWCSLFPFTLADPLNPYAPHGNARGMRLSGIHLPEALSQHDWREVDSGRAPERDEKHFRLEWKSARLGNQRRCWLWRPEGTEEMALPLVVVLDGQNWATQMSLLPVLEQQTRRAGLPAAVWLMIDAVDDATRSRELPCNADFWLAVQEELLPQARNLTPFTDDPALTVVAGQSYGGLSALYAGLYWPQRFGCVLTQSGSFWWPNMKFMTHYEAREQHEKGYLTQQVSRRPGAAPLRIFQEAGLLEQDIHFVNQQMLQALLEAGHEVHYRSYHGGHDVLCWRGGLMDGVRWLLGDRPAAGFDADKEKR
ncbi:enterochelin esterase [Serratia symbiotica]|uniref:Enterochelin esterase n=1 Tax=Serratia symbiotica TaxID=138074 RepID=A0A068Z0H4_9GAMM|nr:enterochelin esterase [Serratia symbiotica]MBF1995290.1 enterochelin esterase [Serratia symbiotica]QLH63040.1 enterochelin esterase [Serratia symbiotica]QTP15252.1 enterochelin esterase [Serratia symbiotica]CDS57318.1 enterobactin/ferric enterobactin esterase [Serratia symbiotica]